jgi:hypothetical protein
VTRHEADFAGIWLLGGVWVGWGVSKVLAGFWATGGLLGLLLRKVHSGFQFINQLLFCDARICPMGKSPVLPMNKSAMAKKETKGFLGV